MTPISITAVGLASSLGGIIQAAAAFRAGITRAQNLPWITAHGHDGERALVVGHPVRPPVEGLDGFAAWLRLAQLAWADGWTTGGASSARYPNDWSGTGMILVMPRIHLARHGWEVDDPGSLLDEHLLLALLSRLGIVLPDTHRVVIAGDHSGTAQALGVASARLAAGDWRRAVILAIDSLLDPSSITWLAENARLKGEGNPNGIQPGESAVVLVVESSDVATCGSVRGVTVVSSAHLPGDDGAPRPDPIRIATRWSTLMQQDETLREAQCEHVLDQTGEEWRALSWGHLLSRSSLGRGSQRVRLPAESFGATGAASGALGCALALRAFQRGYAKARDALVWSVDDVGSVGLIHLRNQTVTA